MPYVHVCPLSQVAATVATADASHLITLIGPGTLVERPATIVETNHLFLAINDIVEPADGMVTPEEEHVRSLVRFVETWDRKRPLVVHCYAGISRSTAAAFITLCAVRPERSEADIALRLRGASRFATPNSRIVGFGDNILGRSGRMVEAIRAIGRGEMTSENIPFALSIDD